MREWQENGYALLLVLIIAGLLTIMVSGLFTLTLNDRQLVASSMERENAYYAADAAVEYGLLLIKSSPDTFTTLTGTYSVPVNEINSLLSPTQLIKNLTIRKIADETLNVKLLEISATAQSQKATKTLNVRVRIITDPFANFRLDGVEVGGVGGGTLTINSNALNIKANFSFNGTVEYQNGTIYGITRANRVVIDKGEVYGDVYYKTSISGAPNSGYRSIYDPNLVLPSMPLVDLNWYRAAASKIITGNTTLTINQLVPNGLLFIDGDVTLGFDEYNVSCTIVTTGQVNLGSGLKSTDKAVYGLRIITAKSISFTGNKEVDAVLIATNSSGTAEVTINGTADFYGAIVADKIDIGGNMAIYFSEGIKSSAPPSLPPIIEVINWQEKYAPFG